MSLQMSAHLHICPTKNSPTVAAFFWVAVSILLLDKIHTYICMKKARWQSPAVVKCSDSGVTLFRSEYWIERSPFAHSWASYFILYGVYISICKMGAIVVTLKQCYETQVIPCTWQRQAHTEGSVFLSFQAI